MAATVKLYADTGGAFRLDDWAERAACKGLDKVAILENPDREDEAKTLCLGNQAADIPRCPVIDDCYRWIMPLNRHEDPGGVRHGMTEDERHTKRRRLATLRSAPQKQCPKCGQFKAAVAFAQNKGKKDGLSTYCRTCEGERRAEARKNTINRTKTQPERSQTAATKKKPAEVLPPKQKRCCKCGLVKNHAEFYVERRNRDGRSGVCTACKRAHVAANTQASRDKAADTRKRQHADAAYATQTRRRRSKAAA